MRYKSNMRKHIADMHSGVYYQFTCHVCNKVFRTKNSLLTHTYRQHPGVKANTKLSSSANNEAQILLSEIVSAHGSGNAFREQKEGSTEMVRRNSSSNVQYYDTVLGNSSLPVEYLHHSNEMQQQHQQQQQRRYSYSNYYE